MTCAETRDLFSALADDALAPAERVAFDDHLAGCPECRRELAALLRTVKLVRAIDPAHAPAGFVDRVLAAARPTPWRTRLARRLAQPWPALPLGAAALLVIGGLAVLLFRASPEQQHAAQQYSAPTPSPTAPAPSPTAPTPSPTAPAPSPTTPTPSPTAPAPNPSAQTPSPTTPTPGPTAAAPARETQSAKPAPSADKRAETRAAARDTAPRAESPGAMADRQAPAPPRVAENRSVKSESSERAQANDTARAKEAARANDTARAKDVAQPKDTVDRLAKAGEPAPRVAQSTKSDAPDARTAAGAASTPATPQMSPLSRTGPMTGMPGASPDVTARLRVADVSAAERSLIALAARVGGRQTGRRIDGGRLVVELALPRDTYADFVREATALGAVSIDRQATERATLAVAITVVR